MFDRVVSDIFTILTAIVGVAVLALLVSNKANTVQVIGAASKGFSHLLEAAVSPVTGGSTNMGVTYV
ncbi:MAG: hypothetical protein ACP5EP_12280 [Acidobacteriaceae bacterium]